MSWLLGFELLMEGECRDQWEDDGLLPEHRLLCGRYFVQKGDDCLIFMSQYIAALIQAITRESLTVDSVISMHGDKLHWTEITSAVGKLNHGLNK
jgi:hypothetical protein